MGSCLSRTAGSRGGNPSPRAGRAGGGRTPEGKGRDAGPCPDVHNSILTVQGSGPQGGGLGDIVWFTLQQGPRNKIPGRSQDG